MKLLKSIYIAALTVGVLSVTSCKDVLVEDPKTVFSTEYFKTAEGFESGIVTLYSTMRYLYGPEGAVSISVNGTDEWTYAEQPRNGAGGTGDHLTLGNYTLDAANGGLLTPWNRSFNAINMANMLLEFSEETGMPTSLLNERLGEIRFLRAMYYMNLVAHFGAVPLDLGSGELKFNDKPFQGFNRDNVTELLGKNYQLIIEDFTFATQNLPDRRPATAFRLSKAAAYHMLAKAYIHRGYSDVAEGSDFENAYTHAKHLIDNRTSYGTELQTYYEDIHAAGNDYNSEILFSIERVIGNFNANEQSDPTSISGSKGIDAHNDFCGDYTAVRSPRLSSSTRPTATRAVPYGRPIRRFCPTPYTYYTAFADKKHDSRFDGSFRKVYLATETVGDFEVGVDTAFILVDSDHERDSLYALDVPYRAIPPSEYYFISGILDPAVTANFYPSLSKYEDPGNIQANNQATRPFPVAKLGETYLLLAEAALKTNRLNEAKNYINVLKRRAANRKNLDETQTLIHYSIIEVKNDSDITLDYILDERTRELCGESVRWPDLAVRKKLVDRVRTYNSDGASNIQDFHMLRPIPRSQLDNVSDENVSRFQNPGY